MTWSPANATNGCFTNQFISTCQPSFFIFLTFLTQYLGNSPDDIYHKRNDLDEKYDFIVVGAGSAGSVVANRLSEISSWKVLLLEAGDEQPFVTEIPALFSVLPQSSIDYAYRILRDPEVCKQNPPSCIYLRGKTMGGSSSINNMMYNRGNKRDFDDWENQGNPGWSWKDVLPYFKKSENFRQKLVGDIENHGIGGDLTVEIREKIDAYAHVFRDGWKEVGLKEVDYNSGNQLGVSQTQYTMKNGIRQSTNDAFIRPIRSTRLNLTIRPNTKVTKIIVDPKTKKATGVEYVKSGSKTINKVFARREVIVSAGSIDSPKLLMLSGIGPANDLKQAGIEVIKNLPVGKNYQDHVTVVGFSYTVQNTTYFNPATNKKINDVIQFVNDRTGPYRYSSGIFDYTVYLQTSYEKRPSRPDIQLFYINTLVGFDKTGNYSYNGLPYRNGIGCQTSLMAPRSRGWIKINTSDPIWSDPIIFPNFYADPKDLDILVEGLKMAKRVDDSNIFKKLGLVATYAPSPLCEKFSSDEDQYFRCFAKNNHNVFYHAAGTCKMGPISDPNSVVDSRLRVHGIGGLRVIDASIMPNITRANTNAPTIMIAEKGSDMIKQDWL